MMRKTDSAAVPAVVGLPVLVGLVITLLAVVLSAALLSGGVVGEGAVRPLAALALALGCLAASFLAAVRADRNRFLRAMAAGGCLFVCLVLLGFLWVGQPVSWARLGQNACAALAGTVLGALSGAAVRRKKKRRRRHP